MTHTVVGLFENRSDAQTAMQELVSAGFIKENIDLSNRSMTDTEMAGTASGGDANAGIGDKISNFFSSLFSDDETTASTYANAASDADAILTVQVDSNDRARQAQEILDRNNAMDVNEGSTQGNFTGTAAEGNMQTNATDTTEARTIPVVEEKLNVGKREVERAGGRIRSRIVEKPVEATVRLREEHVVINRRPVDRKISDADLKNFQPGEMELTERAEVPVIGKEARVVEEVEVGKNVTEREETVRDTVRRTEVEVNELDDSEAHNNIKSKKANL